MPEDKKNQISLTKFIANPKPFYGNKQGKKPTTWLKSVDCVCKAVNMSDKDAFVVATSYLYGLAKVWWNSIEDQTHIWKEFTDAFMNQFASFERSSVGSKSGCSTISKALTLRDLVKKFHTLKVHIIEQPKSKSVFLPSTNKPHGKCWTCSSEDYMSPQYPQQPAVKESTADSQNLIPHTQLRPSPVNLVEAVQVFNAEKRSLSEKPGKREHKRTKEEPEFPEQSIFQVPIEDIQQVGNSLGVVIKKIKYKSSDHNICDGLRYLYARKTKKPEVVVNWVHAILGTAEANEDSLDNSFGSGKSDFSNVGEYNSDDTTYSYPYDYRKMRASNTVKKCPIPIRDGIAVSSVNDTAAIAYSGLSLLIDGDSEITCVSPAQEEHVTISVTTPGSSEIGGDRGRGGYGSPGGHGGRGGSVVD
ncbi:hypothetical protein PHYBLDRAFT_174803 [Phycomyces blakesleeanus NRRL 1555(-)]|uniref:Retrotransposon gag domain-containing protein n=1 Tax=Phycomyces blakesleeanus (strain ATCC 8743b / DSM 1359 / FGSC 10004 / NBRC 33097 / NRRL 1555) TaxID=763407 RepID=A0A167JVM1_PHYB8|nr:hypothetical protein PHYBLDRAFT_174803 [Phycomyces blakesleeanus NRRL 1555(-)]OAD66777.1 hypothetical protein PHYBLDRAFT_174803 [Phycomyces blakesleeanus NRRL 1555(-)]|eukprot:XP_018284817.1 hypothetical protein PHYBLDRAFT_174803 [Phycomyces blakesleeanus NRRL 1555(-)]